MSKIQRPTAAAALAPTLVVSNHGDVNNEREDDRMSAAWVVRTHLKACFINLLRTIK